MTTKSTVYPEARVPHAAEPATDGRSTMEAIGAAGTEVKHKLQDMATTGKDHLSEWKGGVQEGIREKPIQYVLIAAAVGAAVGLLFARRS